MNDSTGYVFCHESEIQYHQPMTTINQESLVVKAITMSLILADISMHFAAGTVKCISLVARLGNKQLIIALVSNFAPA